MTHKNIILSTALIFTMIGCGSSDDKTAQTEKPTVQTENQTLEENKSSLVLINQPETIARVNSQYTYTPYFRNSDDKKLKFSIKNKPSFLNFDEKTGELFGLATLEDVNNYDNIIITVATDESKLELEAFKIDVEDVELLDNTELKATQGSQYGNNEASLAIDDDNTTFNHTLADDGNWLQIDLGSTKQIVKVVILPRKEMDWRNRGVKVYLGNKSYSTKNITQNTLLHTLTDSNEITIDANTHGRYLILKGHSFVHVQDVQIFKAKTPFTVLDEFAKEDYSFTLNDDFEQDGLVGEVSVGDSRKNYTYSFSEDNLPFSIDDKGIISLTSTLNETKIYNINVIAENSDGETVVTPLSITVTSNHITQTTDEAKDDFLVKVKAFNHGDDREELLKSYMDYSFLTLKDNYAKYMSKPLEEKTWKWIENDNYIKEGLFSSVFPANPYMAKNLEDFTRKWDDEKRLKYKNVMLGLSINAKEAGIFREIPMGGDYGRAEHKTHRYQDIALFEENIKEYTRKGSESWTLHDAVKEQDGDDKYNNFNIYGYLTQKYNLYSREAGKFQGARGSLGHLRKHIRENNIAIEDVDFALRKEYGVGYVEWDIYRVMLGKKRDNINKHGNPLYKINRYISSKGISMKIFLDNYAEHFKEMQKSPDLELIGADNSWIDIIMDKSNHITNGNQKFMMMSFLDYANMKVNLDNKAPKAFNDKELDWPIFDNKLPTLAWQVLSTEFTAQKRECNYAQSRFFETDSQKLINSYPPGIAFTNPSHAQWPAVYDLEQYQKREDRRFINYSSYTQAVNWYRPSDYYHASIYGIMQLGGVCYRQARLEQHTRTCLNQPSLQLGQPDHNLLLYVKASKEDKGQLQIQLSQGASIWETTEYKATRFFKENAGRDIRRRGLERYSGMVIGTSPSNSGSSEYSKSMMFQRMAGILSDLNVSSIELIKEAVDIAPKNIDAWYQLSSLYKEANQLNNGKKLVEEFKQSIEEKDYAIFDHELPEVEKNLMFTLLEYKDMDSCEGKNGWDAKELLEDFTKDFDDKSPVTTTRKLFTCLANYYLGKKNNFSAFKREVTKIYNNLNSTNEQHWLNESVFKDVDFRDDEKNPRKKEIYNHLLNEFNEYKKTSEFDDLHKDLKAKKIQNATKMLDLLKK